MSAQSVVDTPIVSGPKRKKPAPIAARQEGDANKASILEGKQSGPPAPAISKQKSGEEYGDIVRGATRATVTPRTPDGLPNASVPFPRVQETLPFATPVADLPEDAPSPKSRNADKSNKAASASEKVAKAPSSWSEFLGPLVSRANAGDEKTIQSLRAVLDDHSEIWTVCGDLGQLTMQSWVDLIAEGNVLIVESLSRKIGAMRDDLTGLNSSRLELMMVEQIILTWLQARHAELCATHAKPGSLDQAAARLRRIESAERRFLNAMKSLATLRDLLNKEESRPALRLHRGAGGTRKSRTAKKPEKASSRKGRTNNAL